MTPRPDCGESSYVGTGRLTGKVAVITGGDSGIGRAVAIAYAREGADVVISYLSEDDDARDTARLVTEAGQRAVLIAGDVSKAQQCRTIVDRAVAEFGRIDILVSNAAFQMTHQTLEEVSDEEWEFTFATNVSACSCPDPRRRCRTWAGTPRSSAVRRSTRTCLTNPGAVRGDDEDRGQQRRRASLARHAR